MASLSGRADATLVKAAKDAAMANVPKDTSKIDARISRSNAALAASTGALWSKVITEVGAIGNKLIDNAVKNKNNPTVAFENNKGSKPEEFKKIEPGINQSDIKGLEITPKDITSEEPSVKANNFVADQWQELPGKFTHLDADDNPSSITVANTDEFAEKLRNDIYGISENRKKQIKEINANQDLSSEEKKIRKRKIRLDAKSKKQRLLGVKETMKTSNIRFAEFDQSLSTLLNEDLVNLQASGIYGSNKVKFANALQNKGKPMKDGSKAIQGYNDSGELVFTYVDKNNKPIKNNGKNITLAAEDVESLLVRKSPKRPIVDGLIDVKQIQRNFKFGFDGIENKISRGVELEVQNKDTFLDLAFYRSEGTSSSLADALHNVKYSNGVPVVEPNGLSEVFISALSSIKSSKENPHPYDQDGDGDFDKKDYNTEENYLKLTKKALSGEDLLFSKSLLTQHYKLEAEKYFNDAVNANNKTVKNKANTTQQTLPDFEQTPDTKDIAFYMDMVNDVKEKPVKGYDYDGDGIDDGKPIKK
tara:strand:- start:408 stop:2006 length:1599 start_codon:yes stop_codon:yes gene_type:complete